MLFHIDKLTESMLPCCQKLTYPQFQPFLLRSLHDSDVIAGAAVFMGEAVGLVIGRIHVGNHGTIFFLYVLPRYRGLGIAAQLLQYAEDGLRRNGCRTLGFVFTASCEGRPDLKKLLTARSWSDPKITMELHRLNVLSLSREAWVNRPLPPGYQAIGCDMLTEPMQAEIETMKDTESGFLSPFCISQEIPRHLPTSRYLVREGRVLAWVMTSVMSAQALMYDVLYTAKQVRGGGKAIQLVAVSLKEQAKLGIPQAVYHVKTNNKEMLRFAEKRLLPHALRKAYHWTAVKQIEI